MTLLRIRDFGKIGGNRDVETTLLQPGEWSNLTNIDIESGDIRSAWGESLISSDPPIIPRYLFVFEGLEKAYVVASDGDAIYVYDGRLYEDITPSTNPSSSLIWEDVPDNAWDDEDGSWADAFNPGGDPVAFGGVITFTVFLGTLVVTPSEGVPCYWPGEGNRLLPLPGWDQTWRARTVVAFANHLVALGYDDDATVGAKYRVAWSDAAAEGELPQTWVPAPENLAGSVQLADTEGYLVTAKILRDSLILYKNDSIYRMYLRNDEFVMGFERVISDHGCDSYRGVAALGDVHYFSDRGDVRVFDGQRTQSILAMRGKEVLLETVSDEYRDRACVQPYSEREQIWVGIVPAGNDVIDLVLIYDLVHNAWTSKEHLGTYDFVPGPFAVLASELPYSWDDEQGSWGEAEGTWNNTTVRPSRDTMVFGTSQGIYRSDKTDTDAFGAAKLCVAERTGFLLADLDQNVTLRGIYPEMEGGPVEISVGTRFYKDGPVLWTRPQTFDPGHNRALKVRATGQPCAFRILSQQTVGWRLGALSFDLVPASRRG